MYVQVLIKNNQLYAQDVAHLYEHMLIESFYQKVAKELHINSGVIGYIGGNTYLNVIFLESWFYNKTLNDMFKQHLKENISLDILNLSIKQCEAEDRVIWDIMDKRKLTEQFSELDKIPWINGHTVKPFIYSDKVHKIEFPITVKKSAKSYRSIMININLSKLPLEDKVVYIRLYVIIQDLIDRYIRLMGWYRLYSSSTLINDDTIYSKLQISLPKDRNTNKIIQNNLQAYISNTDIEPIMGLINDHFSEYVRQKTWSGRIVDDLHYINIIAGNYHIAKLATKERVTRIIKNIKIEIESVKWSKSN